MSEPRERAGVAAVERPGRRAQPAQADAVDDERVDVLLVDLAPRARARRRASTRCRPSAPSARPASRPSESAPTSSARCEIDLSPGTAMWPSSRATGSTLIEHRRDDDAVALALEQRGGAARLARSPVTSSVSVPPRSGEMCWSSKSSMLIRSAPSACVIPAKTPGPVGDVDAHAVERARVGVGAVEHAAGGCRAASPIQRARKPASPASSAASTCSIRRRCSASASRTASALSRKMSTQMRGFAPAMRVMSRSEPPAFASGS